MSRDSERTGMTTEELVALYEAPDSVAPLPALKDLECVDWASVHDAYGPAVHVPAFIRAAVSTDSFHRDIAIQILFQYVWHQGTVYSATSEVVPILYDLLDSDGPHDKTRIAMLLATIADGRPPFAKCEHDEQEAEKWRRILNRSGRSLDREMENGQRYGREICRRLAERLDRLSPYLRSESPALRSAVALAFQFFPAIGRDILTELQEATDQETDEHVKTTLRETIEVVMRETP